jgi:hypothetical protein
MKRIFILLTALLLVAGTYAQPLVYTPTLKAPEDGATKQVPNVTVSWNAISGSLNLQYQVQVDTTASFNSPLLVSVTQTLLTGYMLNQLFFGQTYYWRVRAIDGGTSPWSEVWSFTVMTQVSLKTPANNTPLDQDPNVTLVWDTTVAGTLVTGITFYDYQADTSASFDSPVLVDGSVASSVHTAPTENLRFGAQYHWRVRTGHAADTSDWSDVWNFNVVNKVTLQAPSNNNTNQMLDVSMKWKAMNGIIAYDFEVATDEAFTNLVNASGTDTNAVVSQFLVFGQKYYWHARARHATDTSSWGTTFNFTTINTVLLKTPVNSDSNVSTKPTMSWTGQTGITGFELQVAAEPTFMDPYIISYPAPDATKYTLGKSLVPHTMYYWRMRSFSDGTMLADTTDWSDTWSFTTGNAVGIDEARVQSFTFYPNPAKDKFTLRITSPEATNARLVLMDLLGKTVLEQPFTLEAGTNVREVRIDGVGRGIYLLRLTIDGKTINQKLIVE